MSRFQIFTEEQVASLRRGGKILHDCLQHVGALAEEGVTTGFLDSMAETFIRDHGGIPGFKGYQGFPATLCTSVNEVCVHGIPGAQELKNGDIISIDCGVIVDALYTDACITVPIGSISPQAKSLMKASFDALQQAIAVVKAGARIGDISATVEQVARRRGFSPVRALTGHGLGTTLHQYPDIPNVGTTKTGPVLPAMTLIAIEPIISAGSDAIEEGDDGWSIRVKDHALIAHYEHTVLVIEGGHEVLTDG
ncbi:type I methionyl aminopeptidase [Candidatus Peregrinibacteria bacterium CG1_02_54_53]|nr:MAG: type I methionyl aminopeptidase [Candidatus Peregrinibacteria bacterium CG1_02_54_53]